MPALEDSQLICSLLQTPKGIPFSYLYDSKGSDLYEDITKLEEYYPFNAEEKLLKSNIDSIINQIPAYSVVVELGCGTARKTAQILNALVARDGSCRFAGVDVSASFLEEARTNLLKAVPGMKTAQVTLVEADYIDGLRVVREKFPSEMLCLLWLGSSVGNLTNDGAVQFLEQVVAATGPKMQMFLCTDMWKDRNVLYAAYHDKEGVTELFIKNGVRNALQSLGYEVSDAEEQGWNYVVEVNEQLRRVEMWVQFPQGRVLSRHGIIIKPGERILMEVSRKFTVQDIAILATRARFCVHATWRDKKYGAQMIMPAEEAMRRSWADTDTFFAKIPDWSVRPIDLRHPFCFYYGHVAAFAKIKMLPHEDPSEMETMFSRGIDPIVLDPSKCHSHPDAPPEWPPKEQIVAFVAGVRAAMLSAVIARKAGMKLVNLALEHDRMHQETLCYMLAQQRKAPFELSRPVKPEAASRKRTSTPTSDPDIIIPGGEVILGVPSDKDVFVWDNEEPALKATVPHSFAVSSTPVSIGEFHRFVVEHKGYENPDHWNARDFNYFKSRGQVAPATWSLVGGEYYVHTTYETSHWSKVADKPVFVSLSEAEAFCQASGCRIMTEPEYQRILDSEEGDHVQSLREGGWEWTRTIFEPFPGFHAMPEYPEYSVDFFDGEHYVLKGSSPETHPSMLRDSFRNFFQRQYPFVFAKFRCCRNVISQ